MVRPHILFNSNFRRAWYQIVQPTSLPRIDPTIVHRVDPRVSAFFARTAFFIINLSARFGGSTLALPAALAGRVELPSSFGVLVVACSGGVCIRLPPPHDEQHQQLQQQWHHLNS
mmetsp:Transcript_101782/g.328356  ORF Transcript_101782/g.328356 Transcript_101782/m.328356 type:complete len:115 (-) Transcript_101782:75-419(-)